MQKLLDELKAKAPSYCSVADDGALFHCSDCGTALPASKMLYWVLPNGKCGISCRGCLDDDWMALATKVEGSI